jgi:hypothetical protein
MFSIFRMKDIKQKLVVQRPIQKSNKSPVQSTYRNVWLTFRLNVTQQQREEVDVYKYAPSDTESNSDDYTYVSSILQLTFQ